MQRTIVDVDMDQIMPGDNDRTVFNPYELEELAASIRANGLAQPITLRELDIDSADMFYEIVAGERRFRACKLLGKETVPAIVADLTEQEASAIMLAENTSRADLDPVDEALAYQKRMLRFGWNASEIAEKAGVTSIQVHFRLKLLKLRPDLQALIRSGNFSIGYAQILADADLDTNRQMIAVARLRERPSPTPGWFRREVGQLQNEQAQLAMFDARDFFTIRQNSSDAIIGDPPHPDTTRPPLSGDTTKEIAEAQITYWEKAAEAWDRIGKPFKRQECQAAASALRSLTAILT